MHVLCLSCVLNFIDNDMQVFDKSLFLSLRTHIWKILTCTADEDYTVTAAPFLITRELARFSANAPHVFCVVSIN